MARKPSKPRKPSKASIKAAADRAEKRAKGEDIEDQKVPIDPKIKTAEEIIAAKPKPRRKTKWSPAVGKAICKMLAGGMSVKAIGRRPAMPSSTTILTWAHDPDHPFADQYARARATGYRMLAEEIVEIADDGTNDWMKRYDDKGEFAGYIANGEHLQRSRLRIDTRKWMLSKMLPKVYGEKIAQEVSGPGGGPIEMTDVSKIEIARWIAHQLTHVAEPVALETESSAPSS